MATLSGKCMVCVVPSCKQLCSVMVLSLPSLADQEPPCEQYACVSLMPANVRLEECWSTRACSGSGGATPRRFRRHGLLL